jgi:hypothetical protein
MGETTDSKNTEWLVLVQIIVSQFTATNSTMFIEGLFIFYTIGDNELPEVENAQQTAKTLEKYITTPIR